MCKKHSSYIDVTTSLIQSRLMQFNTALTNFLINLTTHFLITENKKLTSAVEYIHIKGIK